MLLVCVHVSKVRGFDTCCSNSGKHSLSPSFLLLNFLRVLINKVSKKSSHSIGVPNGLSLEERPTCCLFLVLSLLAAISGLDLKPLFSFKISVIINSLPDNSIF